MTPLEQLQSLGATPRKKHPLEELGAVLVPEKNAANVQQSSASGFDDFMQKYYINPAKQIGSTATNTLYGLGHGATEILMTPINAFRKEPIHVPHITETPFAPPYEQPRLTSLAEGAGKIGMLAAPLGRVGSLAEGSVAGVKSFPTLMKYLAKPAINYATQAGLLGGINNINAPSGADKENILLDALGGAALGPAFKVGGALAAKAFKPAAKWALTSKYSPLNLAEKAYPKIGHMLEELRDRLAGGVAPAALSEKVYSKAQQAYKEKAGMLKPEEHVYYPPESTPSAAYQKYNEAAENLTSSPKQAPYKWSIHKEMSDIRKAGKPFEGNKALYEKYGNNLEKIKSYAHVKIENLNDFEKVRQHIGSDIVEASAAKDTPLVKSLRNIRAGLDEAVNETAATHPETKKLLETARSRWKEEIVPFKEWHGNEETPFKKTFSQGAQDTDAFIDSYLKHGKGKDAAARVGSLLSILPDQEGKDMVAAHIFKDAKDPKDYITKYMELGTKQKQLLFSPKDKGMLDKLERLYRQMPHAFKSTAEGLMKDMPGYAGSASVMAFLTGHPMIAAEVAAIPALKHLVKKYASPKLVNDFIEQNILTKTSQFQLPKIFTALGKGGKHIPRIGQMTNLTLAELLNRSRQ